VPTDGRSRRDRVDQLTCFVRRLQLEVILQPLREALVRFDRARTVTEMIRQRDDAAQVTFVVGCQRERSPRPVQRQLEVARLFRIE